MADTSNTEVRMIDLPTELCYAVASFNSAQQWYLQAKLGGNHFRGVELLIGTKLGVRSGQYSGLLNLFDWDEFDAMEGGFEEWSADPERPIALLSDEMVMIPKDIPSRQESALTGQVRMVPVDETYWQKHGPQLNQDAPQTIELPIFFPNQISMLNLKDYEVKNFPYNMHNERPYLLNDHVVLKPGYDNDGPVRVYEISNETKLKATFEFPKDLGFPWFNLIPLSVGKDGNVFYVIHGNHHSVKSLAQPGVIHYELNADSIQISDDRSVVLDWSDDHDLILINMQTWEEIFRTKMTFKITFLKLSPNGDYVAVQSGDCWWIVDVYRGLLRLIGGKDVSYTGWKGRDLFSVKTENGEWQLRRATEPRNVIARGQYDRNWKWQNEPFSFTQISLNQLSTIEENGQLYMLEWEEKKGKNTNEQ